MKLISSLLSDKYKRTEKNTNAIPSEPYVKDYCIVDSAIGNNIIPYNIGSIGTTFVIVTQTIKNYFFFPLKSRRIKL